LQGTFYPELTLGAGALSANHRSELQQFLVAVIRQRGCPLHLANLWNAIYFNYDLESRGFIAAELASERIPTRTARERDNGLPVGAFVRVHTEAVCGDLLGEVIYKEGAHPEVDDGWIAPKLSGAPATAIEEIAGQRVAIVRERFVLDLNAFGPGANHISHKQYERLCRRARWLDNHGHFLLEATYTLDKAELEDLDYYAAYLLKEHREGLLAFCFSEELTGDELREALLRSFDAVRDLALTARELRDWRGKYFFLAADYDQRLNDDGPLGGRDLALLYRGLMNVPVRERCCYSALRPRILELLERDGHDPMERTLVSGSSYVTAVCHMNSYVADRLTREQPDGVLASGVHLRLDDDWQAGGIWRAERAGDRDRYSLRTVPPILPLGLGYAEASGAGEATEPTSTDEQPIASSQTGFRVSLTRRDRALGRLRLSVAAAQALAPGVIDVVIRHGEIPDRRQVQRDGSTLYGVEYPWDLHPGIVLHGNVEASGSMVRIRTVPVTQSLRASDGKSFDYDTNISLYEREMKLRELSREEKHGAPTLTELINRAFRLRGRVRDGWRVLSLVELAAILLGPGWRAVDTRPIADALDKMDLGRDGAHYLWRARVTQRTRASDRSLLAAYGEARPRGRLDRAVRRHLVRMHLRRYTNPSAEKRRTYAAARLKHGMHGVLPEELPPHCSWVEPYHWGDDGDLTTSEIHFDDDTDDDRRRPVVFETPAD